VRHESAVSDRLIHRHYTTPDIRCWGDVVERQPRGPADQAQAASPLLGVQGLMFLGFPLHAAGRPSDARGAHLFEIKVPMLFLQGTRDALAATELIEALVRRLGDRATLKLFQDSDHSFHVPARSGRSDAEVKSEMLDELAAWLEAVVLNLAESRRLRHVVGKVDTYRTKVELPSKMNSG